MIVRSAESDQKLRMPPDKADRDRLLAEPPATSGKSKTVTAARLVNL